MNMEINSISHNIKTLGNKNDLSLNIFPLSTSIFKPFQTTIKKNIFIFLTTIAYFINLIGLFQGFYSCNRYGLYLERNMLPEESILRIERTLSENITIKNTYDMNNYYSSKRTTTLNNIGQINLNINGKMMNALHNCNPVYEEMLPMLDSAIINFRINTSQNLQEGNQTWFDEWKKIIDEHVKSVEKQWIGIFNTTDTRNITAICSLEKNNSMINETKVLYIVLPMFFIIFVIIILFWISQRTSIRSKLNFRRKQKKRIQQNMDEM